MGLTVFVSTSILRVTTVGNASAKTQGSAEPEGAAEPALRWGFPLLHRPAEGPER